MAYQQGDVVWAWLPFTNGVGGEEKEVVIVSLVNRGKDVTIGQLTGQIKRATRYGGYALQHCEDVPLRPMAFRPKLFVILRGRVSRRIGKLHPEDLRGVLNSLRLHYGL